MVSSLAPGLDGAVSKSSWHRRLATKELRRGVWACAPRSGRPASTGKDAVYLQRQILDVPDDLRPRREQRHRPRWQVADAILVLMDCLHACQITSF